MSYRYEIGENTEQEIKRIIEERFDRSVNEFKQPEKNAEHANHQMRKNMKKVRAALRLVRKSTGKKKYKRLNAAARDTARMGAELRESEVAIETIGKLRERFNWKSDDPFYQAARSKLRRNHQKFSSELLDEQDYQNKILARLEDVKAEMNDLSFEKDGFEAFEKSLKKVYKRGRKARKRAAKKATFKNHHEWRKRVKYLWYQIRIIKAIWPEYLSGYSKELHRLATLLGDNHDLYDLKTQLRENYSESEYSEELEKTESAIDTFASEIGMEAQRLGKKIYAEKPAVFVNRIRKYWYAANSG